MSPNVFANEDAAYILAYSVIMLNTDRHNNQVSRCCKVVCGCSACVPCMLYPVVCFLLAPCVVS